MDSQTISISKEELLEVFLNEYRCWHERINNIDYSLEEVDGAKQAIYELLSVINERTFKNTQKPWENQLLDQFVDLLDTHGVDITNHVS